MASAAVPPKILSSNLDLCAKHSCKNLAMTLGSCNVKKEDRVGAGPQKMAVYLSLIEQYAGQSNTNDVHLLLCQSEAQTRQKRCPLSTFCPIGLNSPVSAWKP